MAERDRYHRNKPNIQHFTNFKEGLIETTAGIPQLRVLDYGAGDRSNLSNFSHLQADQMPTFVYHSQSPGASFSKLLNPGLTEKLPKAEKFDLVVCSFSLHHMKKPPEEVLKEIRKHGNPILGINEYDFTNTSLDEFQETFIADAELVELREVFNGDIGSCYRFHTRLGRTDYESALKNIGYEVTQEGQGEGLARFKFFLIARPKNQPSQDSTSSNPFKRVFHR